MGIKLLNLLLPWRLRFSLRHQTPPPTAETIIRLFRPDGAVKIFNHPVAASVLMAEFPKHLVCHSDSFVIGQIIPSLSDADELKLGHSYFLLPKHAFASALSFVTLSSFASSSEKLRNAFLKNSQPFEVQKTGSGCLRVRVSEQFLSELMEEEEEEGDDDGGVGTASFGKVCTTAQLQKDYKRLVRQRQWKPKLETIKEKKERRKLSSSFGIKKKKKSKSSSSSSSKTKNISQRSDQQHNNKVTSIKAPSRSKLKFSRSRKS